jgi:hypothetical protein
MKTMILWTSGCRKPKMQGTATAVCSAVTIETFRRMARERKGYLWIVDAETAADAREMIKRYRAGLPAADMNATVDDGRTVALGTNACLAIGGAR